MLKNFRQCMKDECGVSEKLLSLHAPQESESTATLMDLRAPLLTPA